MIRRLTMLLLWAAVACTRSPGDETGSVPSAIDVSVWHPYEPPNTMMFAVEVTPPGDAEVTVGFARAGTDCEDGVWTWGRVQRSASPMSWNLYNFQPDEAYDYKVEVRGVDTQIQCGELGTPRLPAALAALNLTYAKRDYATRYVLLDITDCSPSGTLEDTRAYVAALDPDTEQIVWYLDVAANGTLGGAELTGWRYQAAPSRIMGTVDKRYFYEWAFDGTAVRAVDFAPQGECDGTDAYGPCVHHDAFRSDFSGKTYIVTSEQSDIDGTDTSWSACGTTSRFLRDGFHILDDSAAAETKFLITDYGFDPHVDEGPSADGIKFNDEVCNAGLWEDYFDPYGTIDWTHLNTIAASSFGGTEVLDLSLKGWNQILRIDAAGSVIWRLSPHLEYSDWPIVNADGIAGPAGFARQHDAYAISEDAVMVFDNLGYSVASRVLRIELESETAIISRSWVLADGSGSPLSCRIHGSAGTVPGTDDGSVLAMCNNEHTVVEISDSSGNAAVPPLAISLPETGFCDTGGLSDVGAVRGWYRAYAVDEIGEF